MAKKFLIWTMQRSGGTSFTKIIAALGNYADVKHEPFNGNQEFGYILKNRKNQSDRSEYYNSQMKCLFQARPNLSLKHCYEVHDDQLNASLYMQARIHGYINVLLTRRNNFERQVSLYLAKKTGAWSKTQFSEIVANGSRQLTMPELDIEHIIEHELSCRSKESRLRKILDSDNNYLEVQYENLYSGDIAERFAILDRALTLLDVPCMNVNMNKAKIVPLLMYEKQTTKDVYSAIPNFDDAKESFAALDR